jgi:DHA1 family bicyclomycin/chloramphenicol resistance-like MFS transporter
MSALLTAMVALAPFAVDMFLPSMPAMARAFDTPPARVQLTVTLFIFTYAVSQLVFGPFSDRFGRRPMMLSGLVLFTLAGIACLVAPTINVLIAARAVQGFAAGSGPVLGRAVVRDVYERERAARVLAYMASAMAMAPILAPIVGGFLQVGLGWRSVFAVLTGLGLVLLLPVWAGVPETNRRLDAAALAPRRMLANYAVLLRNRAYVGYTLVVAFMFAGQFAFISGSAFVLVDIVGVSPDVFGFCFGFVAFGLMTGAFLAGRITLRLGVNRLIGLGTALGTAAGLLLAVLNWGAAPSVWSIVLPMYGFAVGAGLVMPSAMAGAISPFPHMAGLASAVLGFLQMAASALYAMGVGAWYDGTARPMTVAIAMAATGALLAFHLAAPYRVTPGEDPSTDAA